MDQSSGSFLGWRISPERSPENAERASQGKNSGLTCSNRKRSSPTLRMRTASFLETLGTGSFSGSVSSPRTGNLDRDALALQLGDSINSRLIETGGVLEMTGPSHRLKP